MLNWLEGQLAIIFGRDYKSESFADTTYFKLNEERKELVYNLKRKAKRLKKLGDITGYENVVKQIENIKNENVN